MGIFFAFVAMFAWAFGDFLIQRSTRKFGNVISLFFIELLAVILIFPFVSSEVAGLVQDKLVFWVLFFVSAITLAASLLEFEALRRGKLSVIEPIFAFELPITGVLAVAILGEIPTPQQIFLLTTLLIGIILVSLRVLRVHIRFEVGVFLAIAATVVMAFVTVLFGTLGRLLNPLTVIWFASAWITLVLFVYLWSRHGLRKVLYDAEHYKALLFSAGLLDNIAWIAFVYSMKYIPIAVASGITESYLALSVLLGLAVNREPLERHQKVGLVLTIGSAILLAVVTR